MRNNKTTRGPIRTKKANSRHNIDVFLSFKILSLSGLATLKPLKKPSFLDVTQHNTVPCVKFPLHLHFDNISTFFRVHYKSFLR